jgi:hypothetical protein
LEDINDTYIDRARDILSEQMNSYQQLVNNMMIGGYESASWLPHNHGNPNKQ